MKKRIVFLTGSNGRDIFMWKLYQEIKKYEDIAPLFIATSKMNESILLDLGATEKQIACIFARQETSPPDLQFLQKREQKYNLNLWDIWSITSVRKKSRAKLKSREITGYFQYVFEKTESIVDEFRPDYFVCGFVAGFHSVVIHEIFRSSGVELMKLAPTAIPNRFTILNDLSNIGQTLKSAYEKIRKEDISLKEKEIAENFISNFQDNPSRPDDLRKFKRTTLDEIKRGTRYLYKFLKYRILPVDYEFITRPIKQKFYDFINIFEKPKPNEKYVVFPLHVQPEATTLIHGKWYVDQAALVENISKAIPVSHALYVKEHPGNYGNRTMTFYQRIKKLPNVKLISPHENNFDLIKNCSLMATITGTSGWEALLFQKPVITFGNIFYNLFEETKKVEKIEELPSVIKERLDEKINYDKLVKFVAAMFKSSHPGRPIPPADCADCSLEDKNIELVVAGMLDHIKNKEGKWVS